MDKQRDLDFLTLQHETNTLKKRMVEMRKALEEHEEKNRNLSQLYKDIVSTTESLGNDLQTERQKSQQLDDLLKLERSKNESHAELQVIVDDLQNEKKMLEQELQNMMNSRFINSRDEEYELQISTLKGRIVELQNNHSTLLKEKLDLYNAMEELKRQIDFLTHGKQVSDTELFSLKDELEQLRKRFKVYQDYSASDIEEAFALLHMKRESGVTLEFLNNLDSVAEDKKKLQELRKQYAMCVQDLEKTTKLLKLQESINQGYKGEIEQLKQKMKLIQNEYEFRLEEYCRLADVRGHRIEVLERDLKRLHVDPHGFYINVVVIEQGKESTQKLQPGQNIIAVHIQAALFNEKSCEDDPWLKERLFSHEKSATTFVAIDFYDFETEISGIGFGVKPVYDHTAKYTVNVDDFFLDYLQSKKVALGIYHANGLEFTQIGYSVANFKELVYRDAKSFSYVTDIVSEHQQIIGKLEYRIDIEIAMPLAIKAFHERVAALDLLHRKQM